MQRLPAPLRQSWVWWRLASPARPNHDLAALLEPESRDSFLAWGFFPEMLTPAPSTDDFILAALGERLLATEPALKAEFEAKLRAEPAFAANADARLAWLYAQAGPGHPYPLRYPILREVD